MRFLVLMAVLLAASKAIPHSKTTQKEWEEYKKYFGKVYSADEDEKRLKMYLETKASIDEHNEKYSRGETSYQMGVNEFTDWFQDEYDRLMSWNPEMENWEDDKDVESSPEDEDVSDEYVPHSVNWVDKGVVTEVKDQKSCGSCWAFASVGAIESQMAIHYGNLTNLSVQELIDCSSNGCHGGLEVIAYKYCTHKGLDSDISYPYTAHERNCRAKKPKAIKCKGYKLYRKHNEQLLKKYIANKGPIAISYRVEKSILRYHSGVYETNECKNSSNHAMLAVGYGRDKNSNKKYWLIKNSWGRHWGEGGYLRSLRDAGNMCHVASRPSCPKV